MNLKRFLLSLTPRVLLLIAALSSIGLTNDTAQKERTVTALEQDLKTDPTNAELWLHLGFAYRKLDQVDNAQRAFEKASSLNPRNREALYMLGLIYEKKNQTQAALQAWKRYVAEETDPEKRSVGEKHIHHLSQ